MPLPIPSVISTPIPSAVSMPVQEPYQYRPATEPQFHGTNSLQDQEGAEQASAPYAAKLQQVADVNNQAQEAAKFQQHVNTGVSGMQAYIADLAKTHPDLAGQFQKELTAQAPWLQDLKGKDLFDAGLNLYGSWVSRSNGADVAEQMQQNPDASLSSLLPYAHLGAEKTLDLKSQGDYRAALMRKADASTDYMSGLAKLKTDLEASKEQAAMRRAQLRVRGSAGNIQGYQTSYAQAQKWLVETENQIKDVMAKDPGNKLDANGNPVDPITASAYRAAVPEWGKHLQELNQDRQRYRNALLIAERHGAKGTDNIDIPTDSGQPASTVPTPPGMAPPAPAPIAPKVTSQSPDADLRKMLSDAKQDTSGATVQRLRDALKKDEDAGLR